MVASEAQEQEAFVCYCDARGIPVFHIPNGGRRNAREAAHLKRLGVRPGVPDLFVPIPSSGMHGLFIEMKSKSGRTTELQQGWLRLLADSGYGAVVCHGADEAVRALGSYMGDM